MTDNAPPDTAAPPPAPARDFDGLYKALLEAHPRDALHLLCGARLDDRAVVLDGPTEQPRQRSRQRDKVFLVRHGDGVPIDVYHVEVQVKRTDDFEERMVAYWGDVLEQSEVGREIARRNLEKGLEKGLEQGREQGLELGHVDGMRALLRARYGEFADLDDLARLLAERDHDGNIARIVAGATLADLRS